MPCDAKHLSYQTHTQISHPIIHGAYAGCSPDTQPLIPPCLECHDLRYSTVRKQKNTIGFVKATSERTTHTQPHQQGLAWSTYQGLMHGHTLGLSCSRYPALGVSHQKASFGLVTQYALACAMGACSAPDSSARLHCSPMLTRLAPRRVLTSL